MEIITFPSVSKKVYMDPNNGGAINSVVGCLMTRVGKKETTFTT